MLDDVEDRSRKKKTANAVDLREEIDAVKGNFLKTIMTRVFMLFYDLNLNKLQIDLNYHVLLIVVEAFQIMSLVMNDGVYSTLGPYDDSSPWNIEQT
jgi:hypothetical protein